MERTDIINFLVISLKLLQSDRLMKCKLKDILIMTLGGVKMTLDMQQFKRCNANNGLCIVGRKSDYTHMNY